MPEIKTALHVSMRNDGELIYTITPKNTINDILRFLLDQVDGEVDCLIAIIETLKDKDYEA